MKLLKKSILLSLVATLLFSLLSFTNAVAGEGKVVTIRVYEVPKGTTVKPKIIIIEEGTSRIVELERYDKYNPGLDKNLETLNNLLEQYNKTGFKIENATAITMYSSNDYVVTTY